METITIDDDDDEIIEEFNYEVNKAKYYLHLAADSTDSDNLRPETVTDRATIIKTIKFGSDMNKNRSKYMDEMDVIQENGKDILIVKRLNPYEDPIIEVVPKECSFDAIAEAHLALDHAVGERFMSMLEKKYDIPLSWIKIFLGVCNVCSKVNLDITNKTYLDKINVAEGEEKIAQESAHIVEWTIFKMPAVNGFQYVFCYIDLISFYVILKPLKNFSTPEITLELIKIFADFGIPDYYYCDISPVWLANFNITLTANTIAFMLSKNFPKPLSNTYTKKYLAQGIKNNIKFMLRDISNWPVSVKIVQWQYNTTNGKYYLRERPYKEHFGCLPDGEPKLSHEDLNLKTLASTKDICTICLKQMFKKYVCMFCHKSCHLKCCETFTVMGKIQQLHYKCLNCCHNKIKTSEGKPINEIRV